MLCSAVPPLKTMPMEMEVPFIYLFKVLFLWLIKAGLVQNQGTNGQKGARGAHLRKAMTQSHDVKLRATSMRLIATSNTTNLLADVTNHATVERNKNSFTGTTIRFFYKLSQRNKTRLILMAMLEFRKPWYRSDVILQAEDCKFHVHKNTLVLWSPVLDNLIKARKSAEEAIELPKKKAKEVYELLLVIYNLQTINSQNLMFLLKLAKEFEIEKVLYLCNTFLLGVEKPELKCINFLLLAEHYRLDDVKQQCIELASTFSLHHLRTSNKFEEVGMESKFSIAEGIILRKEAYLMEVKRKSFKLVQTVYLTAHEKFVSDMQPTVRRPFVYSCRKKSSHSFSKENGKTITRSYDIACTMCRTATENWARRKEQCCPLNRELYHAEFMKEMFNLCSAHSGNKPAS